MAVVPWTWCILILYITFSSKESSCLSNVYINPELNIINPSSEVLDLGVYMSSNCTFDFHVSCVYKRCSNLSGWFSEHLVLGKQEQ